MVSLTRIYWGLSGFFGAKFFAVGLFMPFIPVVLSAKGLSASQIAVVLAAGPIARIVAAPWLGSLSDRLSDRRHAVIAYVTLGAVCLAPLPFAASFPALFAILTLSAAFTMSALPVADALAVVSAKRHALQYGQVRLWGSIAFIAANFAGGLVLDLADADWIVLAIVASTFLTIGAAFGLPRASRQPEQSTKTTNLSPREAVAALLAVPTALWLLIAAALVQAAHAMIYGFGTLYWQAGGLSGTWIGLAWAIGVVSEIILFAVAGRFVGARVAVGFVVVGALAGVARWTLLPFAVHPTAVLALQVLHGFTFGATHLGAMRVVAEFVPERHAGGVMGLYTAVSGIVMAGAFAMSGPLYDRDPALGFWAMAGLCLLALVVTGLCRPAQTVSR